MGGLARATVEGLIVELERPQGNGGPPLEYQEEALANLRELHKVLGQLIDHLEKSETEPLNKRLVDEAATYFSRAAKGAQR